jgi:hypothetical protein
MSTLTQKSEFLGPCLKPLLVTIVTTPHFRSSMDPGPKPENITNWCSYSLLTINCLSLFPEIFTFIYCSTTLSTSRALSLSLSHTRICIYVAVYLRSFPLLLLLCRSPLVVRMQRQFWTQPNIFTHVQLFTVVNTETVTFLVMMLPSIFFSG